MVSRVSLDERFSFDPYTTPLIIESGLIRTAVNQNQWYAGEKAHHEVGRDDAKVDWDMRYGKEFRQGFEKNFHFIMDYVSTHRNEIQWNGDHLVFSNEQFKCLVLDNHSKEEETVPAH